MRVLVVDDDYVSRAQVKALLGTRADCDGAPSGELALALFVHAHQESAPYALVALDVDMPGLSGQEVVQRIRDWEVETGNNHRGREVKVLMISGMKDGKNIMASFRHGAEGYVIKPITPQKLKQALTELELVLD